MDTLLFGTNRNEKWQFYLVGALLAYELVMLIRYYYGESRTLHFRGSSMLVSVTYILLLALTQVSAVLRSCYAMEIQYFYHILLFIVVVTTVHLVSCKQFIEAYIDIMRIFGVAAIILFACETVGIAYHLPSYRMFNSSGHLYYHFGLGVVAAPREYVAIRAYGIFREPGVLAIYMCVALCFELFFKKTIRLNNVLILGLAALLSLSTAGYIALGIYIALYVMLKPSKTNKELLVKGLIIMGCLLMVVFGYSDEIQKEVFGKLYVASDSLNSRVYSIIGGFTYSLHAPFFGQGWMRVINDFASYMHATYGLSNIAFTNTYIRMGCTYGWIFAIFALYGTWLFYSKLMKRKGLAFLLFFCWIIIFSNENFLLNPLIYLVAYYGYDCVYGELERG